MASKKPNAMLLFAQVGLTRVSPKPANAPPSGFITCCSTKLGTPGMSNCALEQFDAEHHGQLRSR